MFATHLWAVHEVRLESACEYADPLRGVQVHVTYTGPSGQAATVMAFWDGGRIWRARFCPSEPGTWAWASACSDPANTGLHGATGTFVCEPYTGDNPLYVHGPVRISADRRHLCHADGTPFFWLADTAWNGIIRSGPAEWDSYLDLRRRQRFTAIQFVATQWRGSARDPRGARAFEPDPLRINPEWFQRFDVGVNAINARGLLAVPVMLWALLPTDPGQSLPEEDAILLAQYQHARWGAHQVAWLLGGDGHYEKELSRRWCRIGRAVFGERHDRLVTMHPCGHSWVGAEFRDEPWYDFIGYQSSHSASDDTLRWITAGPPARDWATEPRKPVINLEPNYEAIPRGASGATFTDRDVRRASYWSLLVSPTAGVTFGHQAIWNWNLQRGPSEGHGRGWEVDPWHTGLETPGTTSMTVLHDLFASVPWWELQPAPEMVASQPGQTDPARFVAASRSTDGRLSVVYMPVGGELKLNLAGLAAPLQGEWANPRSGQRTPLPAALSGAVTLIAPDAEDWLLVLRS